jgi:hypothetical protein
LADLAALVATFLAPAAREGAGRRVVFFELLDVAREGRAGALFLAGAFFGGDFLAVAFFAGAFFEALGDIQNSLG